MVPREGGSPVRSTPKLVLLSVALVTFFSGRTVAQNSTAERVHNPDQRTIEALERRVPELMKQADIPGLSMAVIRNGKTYWLREFGLRNTGSNSPVTADTVFEAASLSKPVFAYGVLQLVDKGKLDLDAPLSKYLPKPYIDGDPRIHQITARFVLSHRTGFRNWRGDGNPLRIYFTPGERFSYSGEGYVYLQKVVEQITGKPLNTYMAEAVFTPLGMTSSSYVWRADYDDRAATGHDADAQPRDKFKPKEPNAAASLHTTARDYAIFLDALLNRKGLRPQTLHEMEKPQIAVNPECTNCTEQAPKELSKTIFWGLGWGIQKSGSNTSLWHWGDNGSFKCFVVANPSRRSGAVMFTNSENGLAIAPAVMREATGSDPLVFSWLKYDAYDSAAMKFRQAVRDQGAERALELFAAPLKDGAIPEGAVNNVGYHLLRQKHTADAIKVFRFNTQLHPQSANAFDSLGEGYMVSGDKAQAIENYQRSLALDPKNNNAVKQLAKLQGS